jgi:hypothetical protein
MRFPWDSAGRPVPWPEEKGGFDPTNPSHRAVRAKVGPSRNGEVTLGLFCNTCQAVVREKVRQAVEGVKA